MSCPVRFPAPSLVAAALLLTACTASSAVPPSSALAPRARDAGRAAPPSAPRPDEWRALACAGCREDGIALELRYTTRADGRRGSHAFVRVRNLNAHDVALVVVLHGAGESIVDDGLDSRPVHRLRLAAAGQPDDAVVLMPARADVSRGVVTQVERY